MQCTKCGADLQPGATVCPSCEERVVPTRSSVAAPRKRPVAPAAPARPAAPELSAPAARSARSGARSAWRTPALVAAVVVVIAVTAWVVFSIFSTGGANTPDAVALRVMQGYAAYDARAILDSVTHASLTATDQATFEAGMAESKAANKGVPLYKDIKVTSVTIDPKDPNAAIVRLTESVLDPVKGTYAPRDDTLSLVKKDGRWLVKLY